MKSYCIKTNNKKIIRYLLNKFQELDFPDIYYCDKYQTDDEESHRGRQW